jgi:hypothetical protein
VSAVRIRFLVDENAPRSIGRFLELRGHDVLYVGDQFAKSTPDTVLVVAAEFEGLVVVTFDRDFKRLVAQLPSGTRTRFSRQAGRISLRMDEHKAQARIEELVDVIEISYQFALARNQRFIMQISETSYTVSG